MDIDTKEMQPRRRLEFSNDEDHIDSGIEDESGNLLHAKISKESIPRVGMEFETEKAAFDFYNAYAKEVGFSVRRSKSHFGYNRKLLDRTFVCSCQGKKGRDKRDNLYKSHRSETRFGCLAMLKINCRHAQKYSVVKFVVEHNHSLASPSKAHLFRSHRRVSAAQASEVDIADSSGIAPRNAFEFMAKQAGGRESLGFARVDYNNYLRSKRTLVVKSGDTGGVLEYLQRMQIEDPNFFYAIQVDEEDLITNIFWMDGRMMADYDHFGDVVCFDTTYRKHKDGRPIALFVGVNRHKQTIIFGVALLYDETTDSFKWLFDTFSRAMGGKLPKTMLTDQDSAMSNALASQWPNTCHRLCVWHLFQNAATHLSHVFSNYPDFAREFSSCVYDHDYEEEFLDAWDKMLQKYDLQSNAWLKRLFGIKEKWALVYGRDTFCADMISTQRSESMNKAIKSYSSYKHDLRRFFEHFQRLLDDRRYAEVMADFQASKSKVGLSLSIQILEHAANVYTPKVFALFQEELGKSYDCHIETSGDQLGEIERYIVKPRMKHYKYVVSFDAREEAMSCSCRKFEFAGILCSHILKMLCARGITQIPHKYILRRWTKDAKKGSTAVNTKSSADTDPKAMMGRHYKDLCQLSIRLATRAAESREAYNVVRDGLVNLLREVDIISAAISVSPKNETCEILASDPSNMATCTNDQVVTARGIKAKSKPRHQSSKRLASALEKATQSKRAKKKTRANPIESLSFQAPTLQHNQIQSDWQAHIAYNQLGSDNLTQVNNLGLLPQQGHLLPLLQHPEAYVRFFQGNET